MSEKLLIVDTDCGIDDAQALLLALAAPHVKVLGITCVFGNTDVHNVCQNVLRVLSVCQREEIPVFRGCGVPLVGADNPFSDHFGSDGLGDVFKDKDPQWEQKIQSERAVRRHDPTGLNIFFFLVSLVALLGSNKLTWRRMKNKRDVYFGPGFVSYDAYAIGGVRGRCRGDGQRGVRGARGAAGGAGPRDDGPGSDGAAEEEAQGHGAGEV
ncbi:hypothetical protein WMY93_024714 [Mugilogobius chulae]|uniref:Inosine/uridine-preferring nucleoside hydrolase domain-containing protein n=1 Tax=Mugilogobius chulae TaxID=88201 RepID=A0AAW0NCF4_9GOBI